MVEVAVVGATVVEVVKDSDADPSRVRLGVRVDDRPFEP